MRMAHFSNIDIHQCVEMTVPLFCLFLYFLSLQQGVADYNSHKKQAINYYSVFWHVCRVDIALCRISIVPELSWVHKWQTAEKLCSLNVFLIDIINNMAFLKSFKFLPHKWAQTSSAYEKYCHISREDVGRE